MTENFGVKSLWADFISQINKNKIVGLAELKNNWLLVWLQVILGMNIIISIKIYKLIGSVSIYTYKKKSQNRVNEKGFDFGAHLFCH